MKEYLPNEFAVSEGVTVQLRSPPDWDAFEWELTRFVNEAHLLTRFRHPNLVRVSDYFEANNTAYIVMDYEDSQPLDVLRRHSLKQHAYRSGAKRKRSSAAAAVPVLVCQTHWATHSDQGG